jgi:hypothetical protein
MALIDGTFDAVYADLPTIPWEQNPDAGEDYYYTSGGELVVEANNDQVGLSVGEEYIGYYHVHIDLFIWLARFTLIFLMTF